MIIGIGIDSVEIHRMTDWHLYPIAQLRKIFSESELTYCLSNPLKRAERLAARFATKEAFFKAYSQMAPEYPISFLTICKLINLQKSPSSAPELLVDWTTIKSASGLAIDYTLTSFVSITHTTSLATAIVLLANNK